MLVSSPALGVKKFWWFLINPLILFQPPEKPGLHWDQQIEKWDASYQRDVCPQEIWKYDDYYYEPRNVSEDCLHVNIYSPNVRLDTVITTPSFHMYIIADFL